MNPIDFQTKKLVIFDVDGTLSVSRSPIDHEMSLLLQEILKTKQVAIITGGAFADIKKQVLLEIGFLNEFNKNLTLLSTNGGGLYVFDEEWHEVSSHKLTDKEKEKIKSAICEVVGFEECMNNKYGWGDKIQDRNSEITYSALGEHAPIEAKHAWDPDFNKRKYLQEQLIKKLPEFEVKIGGTTSIDITPKGMDKAYGVSKLIEYLKVDINDILFFGDAVYPNGNDYPVFLLGVETVKVLNPEETKRILTELMK